MKIKNIGSKIIGIGTAVLKPDDSVTVRDSLADCPSIKALVERKHITIIKDKTKKEEDNKDATEAIDDGAENPKKKSKKATETEPADN